MKRKQINDDPDLRYLRIVLFLCGLTMGGVFLLLGAMCANSGSWHVAVVFWVLAASFF